MSAGQLRRRMMVQGRQRIEDGAGGWTEDWVDWRERSVRYEPLTRRERIAAMAENLEVTGTAMLRFDPAMPRPVRLVDGDMVLEQVGGRAKPDDRRIWWLIDVKESQADVLVEVSPPPTGFSDGFSSGFGS